MRAALALAAAQVAFYAEPAREPAPFAVLLLEEDSEESVADRLRNEALRTHCEIPSFGPSKTGMKCVGGL